MKIKAPGKNNAAGWKALAERRGQEIERLRAEIRGLRGQSDPVFIKGAITDAYESGWRPDGFGGAPLRGQR